MSKDGALNATAMGTDAPQVSSAVAPVAGLGWIVHELEKALTAAPDELLVAVWEKFDQCYHFSRADYRFWRGLSWPGFWRLGKRDRLRPCATSFVTIASIPEGTPGANLPEEHLLASICPTVLFGIAAAGIDFLYQQGRVEQRERKRRRTTIEGEVGTPSEPRLRTAMPRNFVAVLFEAQRVLLSKPLETAAEAALLLHVLAYTSHLGHLLPGSSEPDLAQVLPAPFRRIDPDDDLLLKYPGLPGISLTSLRVEQNARLIPQSDEDQSLILGNSLASISRALERRAIEKAAAGEDPTELITMSAYILTSRAMLFSLMKEFIAGALFANPKANNLAKTELHYYHMQVAVVFDAAKTGGNSGQLFLAAKLWSAYIFLWSSSLKLPPPPNHCYRVVKEVGLMAKNAASAAPHEHLNGSGAFDTPGGSWLATNGAATP